MNVYNQLAKIETLQAELREQAFHDALTGLYNTRADDTACRYRRR